MSCVLLIHKFGLCCTHFLSNLEQQGHGLTCSARTLEEEICMDNKYVLRLLSFESLLWLFSGHLNHNGVTVLLNPVSATEIPCRNLSVHGQEQDP